MILKRNALKNLDIYAIVDIPTLRKKNLRRFVNDLVKNRIRIIQLRDKRSTLSTAYTASLTIKKTINKQTLFIINDSLELCLLVNADGVHLGQNDVPLATARRILGNNKIIGISCHTITQAKKAQKEGADYIGFGPLFSTPTKQEYTPIGTNDIHALTTLLHIPFFVIGGINQARLKEMHALKIRRVAVCRALCHSRNIKQSIQCLRNYLH